MNFDATKLTRNFDGVQFEGLRKKIDAKYNAAHDELSDCYYNKKPYKTYGILDKETFDKLHGLIFQKRDVEFHQENLKKPKKDQIPEEQYNEVKDKDGNVIGKKNEESAAKIKALTDAGLDVAI
jgi:hypothetical protein